MEISDGLKWVAVMVTAGVVTGLALYYTTGHLEAQATKAARAEIQRLIAITAAQQQINNTEPSNVPIPEQPSQQII